MNFSGIPLVPSSSSSPLSCPPISHLSISHLIDCCHLLLSSACHPLLSSTVVSHLPSAVVIHCCHPLFTRCCYPLSSSTISISQSWPTLNLQPYPVLDRRSPARTAQVRQVVRPHLIQNGRNEHHTQSGRPLTSTVSPSLFHLSHKLQQD